MTELSLFCKKYNGLVVVYKLINPLGQIYIGVTKRLYKRLHLHSRPHSAKNNNSLIKQSIIKYGWDGHEIEILFSGKISISKGYEKEMEFIIKYNSWNSENPDFGLNVRKGNNDNFYLRSRNPLKKRIYQYDFKTKKHIGEFISANEAARFINKSVKPISAAAIGTSGHAYGYYWSYDKVDIFVPKKVNRNSKYQRIVKMYKDGTLIHDIYDSVSEAARKNKTTDMVMRWAVKKGRLINDKFYFIKSA